MSDILAAEAYCFRELELEFQVIRVVRYLIHSIGQNVSTDLQVLSEGVER